MHFKWVVVAAAVRGQMLMFKDKRYNGLSVSSQPYQVVDTVNEHECMNEMGERRT